MDFATDEEILHAERVLLPSGKRFSDDRRAIIKNNSCVDFHACPGSGKTTVLLAKLIILANRMPLADGRGVCVLTHTNVAIDEIKARLGEKANILFTYPNFFGTFQTFVHKFFTDAALKHYFGEDISLVDDDIAMNKLISKVKYNSPLSKLAYARWISQDDADRNNISSDNYLRGMLLSSRINWQTQKIEVDKRYGKPFNLSKDSGKQYLEIKQQLYKEGILTFDEAYQLAFKYIDEVQNVSFNKILENRFAYLFVDEYQDVNPSQKQLVDSIFGGDNIIKQTFGDSDQAIFQEDKADIEVIDATNSINDSCRFGEPIAKVLQSSCVRAYQDLRGNASVKSFKPILVVFTNAQNVLQKFAEILSKKCLESGESLASLAREMHNKDSEHRIFVKAIGFHIEAENESSLVIKSYYPNFERLNKKVKKGEVHLSDFLKLNAKQDIKEYRTNIMNAILVALDASNIQNESRKFSKPSLLKYLRENHGNKEVELKSKIAKWTKLLACGDRQNVEDEMCEYLKDFIKLFSDKSDAATRLEHFLSTGGENTAKTDLPSSNLYHDEQSRLDIEVATIHSVKGETHIATMYLETAFYGKTESQRFKSSFEGELSNKTSDCNLRHCRGMYVGMSRSQYLLCCAIHKNHYLQMDNEKVQQNWDVVEID